MPQKIAIFVDYNCVAEAKPELDLHDARHEQR